MAFAQNDIKRTIMYKNGGFAVLLTSEGWIIK